MEQITFQNKIFTTESMYRIKSTFIDKIIEREKEKEKKKRLNYTFDPESLRLFSF